MLRLSRIIRQFSTNITITDTACIKIKDILKKTQSDIFMLSAKSGGCNGYNYKLDLLDLHN